MVLLLLINTPCLKIVRRVVADDKIYSPYEARDYPILRQHVGKMVSLRCISKCFLILATDFFRLRKTFCLCVWAFPVRDVIEHALENDLVWNLPGSCPVSNMNTLSSCKICTDQETRATQYQLIDLHCRFCSYCCEFAYHLLPSSSKYEEHSSHLLTWTSAEHRVSTSAVSMLPTGSSDNRMTVPFINVQTSA